MFINCENATAADLPAIRKAGAAAANSTDTSSESFSGAAISQDVLQKLENLIINYKPGVTRITVKKVEIGCPVQLKNHVERFYESVYDFISGVVVGFDCILPTEISYHEEKSSPYGGKTIITIATRTYFVLPKLPLDGSEFSLQLEHGISTMLKKDFGYTLPQTLESRPLSFLDSFLDELYSLKLQLEHLTKNIIFGRSKALQAAIEAISNLLNRCSQILLLLKEYNNLQEKVLDDKEELELQLFQLEQLKQQYEQLTRQQEEIIRQAINTGCNEHQRQTFDDAIRKVQDFMQASLDAMKKTQGFSGSH